MRCPRAAVFDLDDTLAESFKAPSAETLAKLRRLLEHIPVAIMTGAGLKRMQEQFLPQMLEHARADRLYIFPNCSAQLYVFKDDQWSEVYSYLLTADERERIKATILKAVQENPEIEPATHVGQQLFDRDAQVAFTLTGIDAPLEMKQTWDPERKKRTLLAQILKRELPEFEVLLGGSTTIDVTRKDITKAYGVRWFAEHLGVRAEDMLYVGDALFEGGNDSVVVPTGIETRAVGGPEETNRILDELLETCAA